jgi:hypothetical protein
MLADAEGAVKREGGRGCKTRKWVGWGMLTGRGPEEAPEAVRILAEQISQSRPLRRGSLGERYFKCGLAPSHPEHLARTLDGQDDQTPG